MTVVTVTTMMMTMMMMTVVVAAVTAVALHDTLVSSQSPSHLPHCSPRLVLVVVVVVIQEQQLQPHTWLRPRESTPPLDKKEGPLPLLVRAS